MRDKNLELIKNNFDKYKKNCYDNKKVSKNKIKEYTDDTL
jgi:hypothetical protein